MSQLNNLNSDWALLDYSTVFFFHFILFRTSKTHIIIYKNWRTWCTHWRRYWSGILFWSRKRTFERGQRTCRCLLSSFDFSLYMYLYSRHYIISRSVFLDLSDRPLVVVHDGRSSCSFSGRDQCFQHALVHPWLPRRQRPFASCIQSTLGVPDSVSYMSFRAYSEVIVFLHVFFFIIK